MIPPELSTKSLVIKPYTLLDENRYVEIATDEISVKFMGGSTVVEEEERKIFKKIFEIYEAKVTKDFWIWGIYENEVLCGHLELKETEHTNKTELEIVYMIHPEYRKKGIMTAILSLVKNNQDIWNKKIIATLSPDNLASLKLLQKWGIESKEIVIDNENDEPYLRLLLSE